MYWEGSIWPGGHNIDPTEKICPKCHKRASHFNQVDETNEQSVGFVDPIKINGKYKIPEKAIRLT